MNRAGEWRDVPIAPDSYIVNIGELMARWTNEHWRATLHRVVNPPAEQAAASRRLSLVFFHNPNYDAPVAALPGTVAARARRRRHRADHVRASISRAQFTRTQRGAQPARQRARRPR